jgi:hypothetical protein
MTRRTIPWLAGLAALAIVTATGALVLVWVASDLQVQVNAFYTSLSGTDALPPRTYEYWDALNTRAYLMYTLASPLLLGAIAAILALLATLALLWETAPASEASAGSRPRQDEVSAAS